jgi:hypothetical protein
MSSETQTIENKEKSPQELRLDRLQAILGAMEEGMTKKEFLEAFQNVVDMVLKIEKNIIAKNDNAVMLRRMFAELERAVKTNADSKVSKALKDLGDAINKSIKDQDDRLELVRERVAGLKDGKTPQKGIDYFDGKNGSPDTGEEIIDKIVSSDRKGWLDKSAIKGLEEELEITKEGRGIRVFGGSRGLLLKSSGTTIEKIARIINFTGATVTRSSTGEVTIAIGGGTIVDDETPTNSGDDLNFTLAHTPIAGSLKLYRGGARQRVTEDYTLVGLTITLNTALATGEILLADYRY